MEQRGGGHNWDIYIICLFYVSDLDVFVWWDLNLKSIETLVGRTARHWRGWWAWLYDGGVLCKFSKRK